MTCAEEVQRRAHRLTILIVEDDLELQELYALLLADEFDVLQAFNGQEAVELFASQRPDLTLMDIKMPIMTGDQAIKRIVELEPNARILAVTAYRYQAADLGVPVLRKGFTIAEFRSRVQQTLNP